MQPSANTVLFFVLVSYFLVTGGLIYDVIVEPPSMVCTYYLCRNLNMYRACVSNLDLLVQSLLQKSSGPQNQRVHIVLKPSKSAGAEGNVPNICGFELTHSLNIEMFNWKKNDFNFLS